MRQRRGILGRSRLFKGVSLCVAVLGLQLDLLWAMDFTDVSTAAGITADYDQDVENLRTVEREPAFMAGGAVAEDFDGDGWVDLFVTQGGLTPNLLYMNQQDGTFSDEAASRGANQTGRYYGACGADHDGDGDIDLFLTSLTGNHLLLNNDGSGNFTPSAVVFANPTQRTTSPSWADVDGDGLLDVAMGAWLNQEAGWIHIYRNLGGGNFAPFQVIPVEWTYVPHFADLNGDGHVDLIGVGDFGSARFYLNDGRGVLLPAGASDVENGMGVATGDPDNDGDLDVFITAIRHPDDPPGAEFSSGNRLLINNGHGEFENQTTASGTRTGYWAWGAVFGDLDNDGDEDLYHVNGFHGFGNTPQPDAYTPARLFENQGALSFTEIAASSGDAADTGQGRCVVSFDYDNDGDLDLFIVNNNDLGYDWLLQTVTSTPGELVLLRNDTTGSGNWLKVRVAGSGVHHPHGMGAWVTVSTPSRNHLRAIQASSNYNGHGPYRIAHFGLGAAAVDEVQVRFPNGDTVAVGGVAVNQEFTIESPQASPAARSVNIGQSVVVQMPAADIPAGGEVVWIHSGVEHPNGQALVFATAGDKRVTMRLYSDSSRTTLLREEGFTIEVLDPGAEQDSIARIWNEVILQAIRMDFPDPAVHARNLFHLSVAMWDGWAVYDAEAIGYIHRESLTTATLGADRREAISYAAYRVLSSRYSGAANGTIVQTLLNVTMEELGYPITVEGVNGDSPAAVGNRVAAAVLTWGSSDASRESEKYLDWSYSPVNPPLDLTQSGTTLNDPNRWQPLQFEVALTQNGQLTDRVQIFVGSHWGEVRPFALTGMTTDYLDPGPPPQLGGAGDLEHKQGVFEVVRYSSWLDPDDGVSIDISPKSKGLNSLGQNDGTGHGATLNPATGQPYAEQWVKRGDYGRAVAEFWADGPDSETPPGHWNTLANVVSDHPDMAHQYLGAGDSLDRLEWDVKLYFALNAALHDAAIAAWSCKRRYDFIRPISSIRHLSHIGELPLEPGLVEFITSQSSAPGQRHHDLVLGGAQVGDVALKVWGGEPDNPLTQYTGTRWIRGEDWLPYQRDTFVTPAFAGYVSGHSCFSRAAAEVLTTFTGDAYFPGGLGSHLVPAGSLEFEYGPSTDITLQWATYYDAADEAGLSRLYGGIHVPADDGPGRIMGSTAGLRAISLADRYFDGSVHELPIWASFHRVDGGFELRGQLVRGMRYRLRSSTDLSNWENETVYLPAFDVPQVYEIEDAASARFHQFEREP